jgi:Golgi SNAP receptor complex protein 1
MTAYESARRQCRTLEALLDSKLSSYSRIASAIPLQSDVEAGTASDRHIDLEHEIEAVLDKVSVL